MATNEMFCKDLGPGAVNWGGNTIVGDASGDAFGDIIFSTSHDVVEVLEATKGTSPIDHIFTGEGCEVVVPMTRATYARLTTVIPGASGSGTTANQVVVRSVVGQSMFDNAKKLIIKPVVGGVISTDESQWLTIFKASPKLTDTQLTFNNSSQRFFNVTFIGYKVRAKAVGEDVGYLYKFGGNV